MHSSNSLTQLVLTNLPQLSVITRSSRLQYC
uniref:Uncharacterized protein n=1 Tax=Rhizophora mucronata TaxID=61149 RepID=A0A2P2P2A4_RHIMU